MFGSKLTLCGREDDAWVLAILLSIVLSFKAAFRSLLFFFCSTLVICYSLALKHALFPMVSFLCLFLLFVQNLQVCSMCQINTLLFKF